MVSQKACCLPERAMPAACQSLFSSHTWKAAANGLPVAMGHWELGLIWLSSQ